MDKDQVFMALNRRAEKSNLYIPAELKRIIFEYTVFKPKNNIELRTAINEFCKDKTRALAKYGIPNTWNVTLVTNMGYMFKNSPFNEDISNWDVSNVTNMRNMFEGSPFNGDISKWNVSNVTNMSFMFYKSEFTGCSPANSDYSIEKTEVNSIGKTIFSRENFPRKVNRATVIDSTRTHTDTCGISKWNVSNVTDMSYMFHKSKFEGDLSSWNVSRVVKANNMFDESKINGDISNWDVSSLENMEFMFANSVFNGGVTLGNTATVYDSTGTIGGDFSAVTIYSGHVYDSTKTVGEDFPAGLSKWDVSNVRNMTCLFFRSSFTGDISRWNVSNVTDMTSMFSNSKFDGDISNWDVSNVQNMSYMFFNCNFTGDLSKWRTYSLRSVTCMFDHS